MSIPCARRSYRCTNQCLKKTRGSPGHQRVKRSKTCSFALGGALPLPPPASECACSTWDTVRSAKKISWEDPIDFKTRFYKVPPPPPRDANESRYRTRDPLALWCVTITATTTVTISTASRHQDTYTLRGTQEDIIRYHIKISYQDFKISSLPRHQRVKTWSTRSLGLVVCCHYHYRYHCRYQ